MKLKTDIQQPRLLARRRPFRAAGSRAAGGGKQVNSQEEEYSLLLRELDEIHSKIDNLLEEGSIGDADDISPESARAALSNSRLRIRRRRFFGESLFGDPAWDMLTELYLSEVGGDAQSLASIALAASVPQSTAFRWIDALIVEGLIVRYPDQSDPKRLLVRLSDKGRRSMNLVFSEPKILILGR